MTLIFAASILIAWWCWATVLSWLTGRPRRFSAKQSCWRRTNVEPPQLVRLAQALGMAGTPLTVEQFVNSLAQATT